MSRRTANTPGATRPRGHMAQNYLVMWVDSNIDLGKDDFNKSLTRLRAVVNEVKICLEPAECIEALNDLDEGKAFVISSGALGQKLVPQIHGIQQLDAIYIFCGDKARHEQWAKDWTKIQGVHTSIKPICESLKKAAHASDHNDMPMSFIPKQSITSATGATKEDLDRLPPTFMYSVIFKEIILEIEDEHEKQMNDLVAYCDKKNVSASQVTKFQKKYYEHTPVWWYTCEMFLYGMLNQALRTLDMEGMVKMGFFIRHLHFRLAQLYQEQSDDFQEKFIVFRGQGLSHEDFKSLCESQGGLLSFNNFLSTSRKKEISLEFIRGVIKKHKNLTGVLFIMTIDPTKITATETPFAWVDDESAMDPKEDEILFTMHTVFRVMDIKPSPDNAHLHEVHLVMTGDNDPQMIELTRRLKEEVGGRGWYRMGQLMLKVGHFDQAEELYNQLLEDATSDGERGYIYHHLGGVKYCQGKYQEAAGFYEESLKIKLKTVPEDDISLAPIYNNIALAYDHMGDYSKALEFYEKDLEITKKALSPTHPDLATSYNNIALVYDNMGDYSKALEFYEKSLKIRKEALPPTHPDLATSYNNIGSACHGAGDYLKALSNMEKAKKIFEISLPENHPLTAFPYKWFGTIYRSMKEYSKSFDSFQKCLQIREHALAEKHPDRATALSDIGDVHRLMGDYKKALQFHQKALDIQENVKCNPLDCATTYVNLGETYREMKDYSTALKYYEKGLKIRQEKLPANHPDLAVVYHNMSQLYLTTGEYKTAATHTQRAVDIAREKLPSTHPHLSEYRETLEKVRKKM